MLQIEVAKSGHTIIRFDGRTLSSLVDPILEARRWYESIDILRVESILMLGIGGGYQLAELIARGHNVVLIDRNYDLVQLVRKHINLGSHKWIQEESAEKVLLNGVIEQALSASVRWVSCSAGIGTDPSYFTDCLDWLIGRTPRSLQQHLIRRRELSCLLDPHKLGKWVREFNPNEPLNVKTLLSLFRSEAAAGRERRIWSVLEELVR